MTNLFSSYCVFLRFILNYDLILYTTCIKQHLASPGILKIFDHAKDEKTNSLPPLSLFYNNTYLRPCLPPLPVFFQLW